MLFAAFGRGISTAFFALLIVLATVELPARAQADPYPNRTIRVEVGYTAGGGTDVMARLVAQRLQDLIGQTVIIENRAGAGGRIAGEYTAAQPPDGYTLMVASVGPMSIASVIYPKLSYHPTRSFVPLAMIGKYPLVLVIPVGHPAKSVKEFVAWTKEHPDKSNYATASPVFTIATEMFKLKTGASGEAIPYKGSNDSLVSVVSGQTLFAIVESPAAVPMVKGGRVRAIAVTGSERAAELPDVPSMAEVGLPDVNIQLWSGFFAPAGTSPAVVKKLEDALNRAITSPEVSAKLRIMAVNPGGGPADEFRRMIDADITTYAEVVKAAGLKFQD